MKQPAALQARDPRRRCPIRGSIPHRKRLQGPRAHRQSRQRCRNHREHHGGFQSASGRWARGTTRTDNRSRRAAAPRSSGASCGATGSLPRHHLAPTESVRVSLAVSSKTPGAPAKLQSCQGRSQRDREDPRAPAQDHQGPGHFPSDEGSPSRASRPLVLALARLAAAQSQQARSLAGRWADTTTTRIS